MKRFFELLEYAKTKKETFFIVILVYTLVFLPLCLFGALSKSICGGGSDVNRKISWENVYLNTNQSHTGGEDGNTLFTIQNAWFGNVSRIINYLDYSNIVVKNVEDGAIITPSDYFNGEYGLNIAFKGDLTGGIYEVTFPIGSLITLDYPSLNNKNNVEIKALFNMAPWGAFGEGFANAELSPAGDVVYFGGNVAVQAVDDTVMINAYYDAQLTQLAFTTTQINNNGYSITGVVDAIPESEYFIHIPVGYLELVDVPGNTNEDEYVIQLFVNIFTDSGTIFSKTIEEGNTLLSMTNNMFDFNLVNTESFLISAFNYSTYTALNILSATNTDTGIELLIEGEPTGSTVIMVSANQIYIIGSDPIRTNMWGFGKGFDL